jgi:NADH:ubiquinone oxidoreductase subunit E
VEQHQLEDKITLAGSFCFGCCNREGVTIQVDGEIFTAVTPETFDSFFTSTILPKL